MSLSSEHTAKKVNDNPDQGTSLSFLRYFSSEVTAIQLVDKRESFLMRAANVGLNITNQLGWSDIKNFMTGYGTTIGRTIYECPSWPWTRLPEPHVVHELTHVVEWINNGLRYPASYLLSAHARCYWESVCIQAEMLCYPDICRTDKYVGSRIVMLEGYGIKESLASTALEERLKEVAENKPRIEAKTVFDLYSAWTLSRLSRK